MSKWLTIVELSQCQDWSKGPLYHSINNFEKQLPSLLDAEPGKLYPVTITTLNDEYVTVMAKLENGAWKYAPPAFDPI